MEIIKLFLYEISFTPDNLETFFSIESSSFDFDCPHIANRVVFFTWFVSELLIFSVVSYSVMRHQF